jgi:hypothetical protein
MDPKKVSNGIAARLTAEYLLDVSTTSVLSFFLSKRRYTEMTSRLPLFSTALMHRLRYRHGLPFITSVVLAVVTTAWPLVRDAFLHKGTSIWTFAVLASISTVFAMLCGGRYRAFFIAIAVTLPFLFFFWFLRLRSASWGDYPSSPSLNTSSISSRLRFFWSGSLRRCSIARNDTPNGAQLH